MTCEELTTRVARGAALLDRVDPIWWKRIDLDQLRMATCYHCTLGQLFGHFEKGLVRLRLPILNDLHDEWRPGDEAVRAGFVLTGDDMDNAYEACGYDPRGWRDPYDLLQAEWVAVITARRTGITRPEVEKVGV